jgi:ribonuclease HI
MTPLARPLRTRVPPDPVTLVIHIDGGARGNPGPAGFGVHVASPDGSPVAELYGFLGIQTNNVAEYAALIAALRYAIEAGARSVQIRSDSELLVKQLRGDYRVKSPGLLPLYQEALRLMRGLPRVTVEHLRRALNKDADALANRAMDTRSEDPPGVTSGLPLPAVPGLPGAPRAR